MQIKFCPMSLEDWIWKEFHCTNEPSDMPVYTELCNIIIDGKEPTSIVWRDLNREEYLNKYNQYLAHMDTAIHCKNKKGKKLKKHLKMAVRKKIRNEHKFWQFVRAKYLLTKDDTWYHCLPKVEKIPKMMEVLFVEDFYD